jgi:hypothetical protein
VAAFNVQCAAQQILIRFLARKVLLCLLLVGGMPTSHARMLLLHPCAGPYLSSMFLTHALHQGPLE